MPDDLFRAADSLRAEYAAVDWSATPLGPTDGWSPTLRQTVRFLLGTRFPAAAFWGPDLVMVYNEAFVPLIAAKHPSALGAPAREVFAEVWDQIGPMMDGVLNGRGATWVEDSRLPLLRRGFLEECYFTFSYSPVVGDDGRVEGLVDIAMETTDRVVSGRRLALLDRLRGELADVTTGAEIAARAVAVLETDPDDLPVVDVRLDGAATRDTGLPVEPPRELEAGPVLERRGEAAVAWVPLAALRPDERHRDHLVARLSDQLPHDDDYAAFVRLVGDVLTQALTRVSSLEAERRVAAAERHLSEALQRSLLTRPTTPASLQVAVSYLPAVDQAAVGGDWYDAFPLRDGSLAVTIGDVAGHDRDSAAVMGQARNLLRGIAYATAATPARVLSGLDDTLAGFDVEAVVTTVFGHVRRGADHTYSLTWSNAGHPPPAVVAPDGGVVLLETPPSPLLGVTPGIERHDHEVALPAGSTLVLYTDGLVERRGVSLDVGLDWLAGRLVGTQELTAEEVGRRLVDDMPLGAEDDVALLVLRVGESDGG